MTDILYSMPVLLIGMGMNILLGLYYQVGMCGSTFQLGRLLGGVAKAGVVGLSFIGLAFCFDRIDLSSLGISPCTIMHSAICLYIGKAAAHLTKILGIAAKKEVSREDSGAASQTAAEQALTAGSSKG